MISTDPALLCHSTSTAPALLEKCPRSTKVSVIPPTSAFNGNALFESRRVDKGAHSPNAHWMDCYASVYKRALAQNIVLGTYDVLPIADADIVLYMALPQSSHEVTEQKRKYPGLKAIFAYIETSLGSRYVFNAQNHRGFDAVLSYNDRIVDNLTYFPMRPHAYFRDRIRTGLPFEQRRVGCLVGTNRKLRYRSGLFTMRSGWKFSFRDWIDYAFCPGQLISYRSHVGSACTQYEAGTFDIFGEGWEMLPQTRHIFRGVPTESTLNYVGNYRYYFAFENHTGEGTLISERIWDALWGDAVPVYRGNNNLHRYVPRECFIDAAQFEDPTEMLNWLCNLSKDAWSKYREAGRDFIRSEAIERFLPDAFAEDFLRPITAIAEATNQGVRNG